MLLPDCPRRGVSTGGEPRSSGRGILEGSPPGGRTCFARSEDVMVIARRESTPQYSAGLCIFGGSGQCILQKFLAV